jgi:hypothetical protein
VKEAVRKELQVQLQSFRPVSLSDRIQSFLGLFDEFMDQYELGLHVVCHFILELDSPRADKATIDRIQRLHAAMGIDDRCVGELQNQNLV